MLQTKDINLLELYLYVAKWSSELNAPLLILMAAQEGGVSIGKIRRKRELL
jgi:hypothetical protein